MALSIKSPRIQLELSVFEADKEYWLSHSLHLWRIIRPVIEPYFTEPELEWIREQLAKRMFLQFRGWSSVAADVTAQPTPVIPVTPPSPATPPQGTKHSFNDIFPLSIGLM